MIEHLTPVQRQIVEAPLRGEIVVGGVAGSGKTLAALHRAAHLCERTARRSNESTVLFLCYNTTLADGLQARLTEFPSRVWSRVQISTVHHWCWPYVKRQFPGYTVLSGEGERLTLVREAVKEARYGLGPRDIFEHDAKRFLDEIRLIKGGDLRTLDEYLDQRVERTGSLESDDYAAIFQVAQHYDRLLRERRRLDFDDYALIALAALQSTRSTARCDHVIVDEAQDLSDRQLALARSLARQSLLIIADQDQAIYRVTRLAQTLPEPGQYDVVLPESLRTTAEIFTHARGLLPDPASSQLPARHGPPPVYLPARWSDEEAEQICRVVAGLLAEGVPTQEIAVLAPT
ncbi:MAG TPA: UvrD-helicase domain-containing protein [Chloroflexaceae bacterium]|nr:UvrD-helicase domain-containing protein [Chloroflexaceae bacterium]